MPFGLLWCCYLRLRQRSPRPPGHVTNAFRPFVVLLRKRENHLINGNITSPMPFGLLWCCYPSPFDESLYGQTKSPMPFGLLWCCYFWTATKITAQKKRVTNAFRPFVVLLPHRRLGSTHQNYPVTNAFRPFVVLLLHPSRHLQRRHRLVTNAFRPFVVLLPVREFGVACRSIGSPMPFGLLWCCYGDCLGNHRFGHCRHQCLSAFCGVVTDTRSHGAIHRPASPMPFGLLWCCYTLNHPSASPPTTKSPMPFGLLWCCYAKVATDAEARNIRGHQCLSAFCGVVTPRHYRQ